MASAKLRQGQIPNGEDNGLLFSPTDNGEVTTPPEVSQIRPPQPWSWQQGVSWQVCTNAHSCTHISCCHLDDRCWISLDENWWVK